MFRERMQSLQKSFGFQEVMQENIRGAQTPAYEFLTFAEKKAA